MRIVTDSISLAELKTLAAELYGDMVKGVVDLEKGILALDAEMHSDLEAVLLKDGSKQADLWGINIYPDNDGDGFVEYNSLINIRPAQGNRSMKVEDAKMREIIRDLVRKRTGK